MKKILAIIGSAQENSSNYKLVDFLSKEAGTGISVEIFDALKRLPHFDTVQSAEGTPQIISGIRTRINNADAVLISSPEYIFSIPSGLKNLLEWCVATTVFSDKPVAIIVASADGKKAFSEIQLIMQTLGAKFNENTCLLISGIKGRIVSDKISEDIQPALLQVMQHLRRLM